jgi:hypothetical protein
MGRGALYAWSESDVLAQALTVREALAVHRKAELARLAAWFGGFDYPVADMRGLWADSEEGQWIDALEFAVGGPFRRQDMTVAIESLRHLLTKTPVRERLAAETVRVLTRVEFDPNFVPLADLTAREVGRIIEDLPRLFSNPGIAAVDRRWLERIVPAALQLVHQYLAPKMLAGLIRAMSAGELALVHSDCRFLLSPLRAGIDAAVDAAVVNAGNEHAQLWLYALPRLNWGLGRMVMIADIALRRSGYASQVDQSIEVLREITADPNFVRAVRQVGGIVKDVAADHWGDHDAMSREMDVRMRAVGGPEPIESLGPGLETIGAMWGPVLRRLMAHVEPAKSDDA